MSEARDQAEASADRIRHEFERTLQELDRRRHDALDVGLQIRRHAAAAGIAGAAVLLAIGGAVLLVVLRLRSRPRRLRHERWEGLRRAWTHPKWVAAPAHSPWRDMGVKVGTAALSQAARVLIQQATRSAQREAAAE